MCIRDSALKFYCSVRIDIRRIGSIKQGDQVIGNRTRVKVVKNKVAPPFAKTEFDILFGQGVSKTGEILDMGVDLGLIRKSGSWYSYGDQRMGQGREQARHFLIENTEIADTLQATILAEHGIGEAALAAAAPVAEA